MQELDLPRKIKEELTRFRIPEAVTVFRALMIDPRDEMRICPFTSTSTRVTIIAKVNEEVQIGYRHADERGKWGIFFYDSEDPFTLGTENYWYLYLEDAFYNSPGWNGELPEDYVIE